MILSIAFEFGGYYADGGGSWITDLIIAIAGASIGSGVTVWALYKTFRQDKKKEEDRRLQFQTEKLKYFQSHIDGILSDLKTQNEFYKEFSEELEKDSFNIPLLRSLSFNDMARVIHKLNLEDYYHSYLGEFGDKKEVILEFKRIISCLDYFSSQIDLYKDGLSKSIEFDYQRKIKLKTIAENAMDTMARMGIDADMQKEHLDFSKFINTALLTFHQTRPEPYTLEYLHDNFILEVKPSLIEYSKTIPEASFILIEMKKASVLFHEIPLQNRKVASDFLELHKTFKEKIDEFEDFTKRILNYDS